MKAYTMAQVAEMLQVDERTIKNLIKGPDPELASFKVGSRRRITQDQLDAYVTRAA